MINIIFYTREKCIGSSDIKHHAIIDQYIDFLERGCLVEAYYLYRNNYYILSNPQVIALTYFQECHFKEMCEVLNAIVNMNVAGFIPIDCNVKGFTSEKERMINLLQDIISKQMTISCSSTKSLIKKNHSMTMIDNFYTNKLDDLLSEINSMETWIVHISGKIDDYIEKNVIVNDTIVDPYSFYQHVVELFADSPEFMSEEELNIILTSIEIKDLQDIKDKQLSESLKQIKITINHIDSMIEGLIFQPVNKNIAELVELLSKIENLDANTYANKNFLMQPQKSFFKN